MSFHSRYQTRTPIRDKKLPLPAIERGLATGQEFTRALEPYAINIKQDLENLRRSIHPIIGSRYITR